MPNHELTEYKETFKWSKWYFILNQERQGTYELVLANVTLASKQTH